MTRKAASLLLTFMLVGAQFMSPTPTQAADQVVSDCGDNGGATQLRAKLAAAQSSGGGTLTFTCGTSITLLNGVLPAITTNTTINGGGAITISGNKATRIFYVNPGATLTLNNVTLSDAFANADGGAIVSYGTLNINSTKFFSNTVSASWSGSALLSWGPLNITNSEFGYNQGYGGVVKPRSSAATTTIVGSSFHDNHSLLTVNGGGYGGAMQVFDGPSVTISSSTFSNNKAEQAGGAIYITPNATVTVSANTTFVNNWGSASGGSIFNGGTLTVDGATLSGGFSENGGAGIYNAGTATLNHVTVSGGHKTSNGGGIRNTGTLTMTDVTLDGNSAYVGGGLDNPGTAALANVTFTGNSADEGGGMFNTGTATLTNVTVSGNTARMNGGGIDLYSGGPLTLNNVTLSGNSAPSGGGIFRNTGTLYLKNTVVSEGTTGPNCNMPLGGTFNLSDDNSCGFGAGHDNIHTLLLGDLANNGGFTQTHLPGTGSAAIDQAECTDFNGKTVLTDQRGVSRPQGPACDVGAVERRTNEGINLLHLPLILR